MTKTHARAGASLLVNPMNCPQATAMTLGFSEVQADRMIRTRRVLPVLEARTVPGLDARKLWERIGKPHGRFNVWASRFITPLMEGSLSAQICALTQPDGKQGRPRTEYLLSRDVAALLAMQANTDEGQSVRAYFLDMEALALKLAAHAPLRAHRLTEAGNELSHLCRKAAEDMVKEGVIPKAAAPTVGHEAERDFLRMLAEVLSGHTTAEWRSTFHGKGIRDVLDTKDLDTYARALEALLVLHRAGLDKRAIRKALEVSFLGRIKPEKYASASAWEDGPDEFTRDELALTAGAEVDGLSDEF